MCNNGSKNDNVPKYCECAADGIWTVIQKRFDGSVDFYRNWTEYKEGFGNSNCEFWLGNDIIHQMTANEEYILKIYLTDWDNVTKYAVYHKFRMEGESSGYRLEIDDYSGDAGDSMKDRHDGLKFSTKDRDNDDVSDISKAYEFHGAWWYGYLTESNLNGQYLGPDVDGENGIMWLTFNNSYTYSMKETKMLIIRKK